MINQMNIFTLEGRTIVDKTRVNVTACEFSQHIHLNRITVKPGGDLKFHPDHCVFWVAQGSGELLDLQDSQKFHLIPGNLYTINHQNQIQITNNKNYDLVLAVINSTTR